MCGFVALLGGNKEENKIHIDPMLDEIAHRGPDGRGKICFDENSTFGHVRLAILDFAHGDQPMISECGRYLLSLVVVLWENLQSIANLIIRRNNKLCLFQSKEDYF